AEGVSLMAKKSAGRLCKNRPAVLARDYVCLVRTRQACFVKSFTSGGRALLIHNEEVFLKNSYFDPVMESVDCS
ncbi:MAG: hypothetical protein V4584_18070, partial [Verrucomicrobiota bacterium]